MDVRVDFTPMVDMMMLLITFFMLCTSLAKPQTMELSMPSNDKNLTDENYIAGIPKYDDPSCLKKTTWGKDGIRKVLITHVTEDGTQPVQQVMLAKAKLDEKKLKDSKFPQEQYDKELAKIKSGEINGQHISTMTVIIKATDNSLYNNLVDALDEMQICSIGKYVIDKVKPEDKVLLEKAGIKE